MTFKEKYKDFLEMNAEIFFDEYFRDNVEHDCELASEDIEKAYIAGFKEGVEYIIAGNDAIKDMLKENEDVRCLVNHPSLK